jgi:hypothetical protein
VKERYVRVGDGLTDDDAIIVRGGLPGPRGLRAEAQNHYVVYGTSSVSVFAVRDVSFEDIARSLPLMCFEDLTLWTVGDIRRAGLAIEPAGREPRHYLVNLGTGAAGVAALWGCEHRTLKNPPRPVVPAIDLPADLNTQDDDGLGWTIVTFARDPQQVKVGAQLVAGDRNGQATVRIEAVDPDGQVHFTILPEFSG